MFGNVYFLHVINNTVLSFYNKTREKESGQHLVFMFMSRAEGH